MHKLKGIEEVYFYKNKSINLRKYGDFLVQHRKYHKSNISNVCEEQSV